MGSKKARKVKQIAAFLEVLAACSGKEPIQTRRDLLAEIEAKEDAEDELLQERRKVFIP